MPDWLVPLSLMLLARTAVAKPDIRLNHIQVIGTHNSYHREISLEERNVFECYTTVLNQTPKEYYYSHSDLPVQLSHQSVRSLELDLHPDDNGGLYQNPLLWKLTGFPGGTKDISDTILKEPGIKVFHIADFDQGSSCYRFTDCLMLLKDWSNANKGHIPVTIGLELLEITPACGYGGICADQAANWTLERLLNIDANILSVFDESQLIRPDDVRQDNLTLEQSVLQKGWPKLDECRNRFLFYFDNDPMPDITHSPRELYRKDASSLENRVVFTNSIPGSPDAAFMERNKPQDDGVCEDIQGLVKQGYLVRTRADEPFINDTKEAITRRDLAFQSGAQIISTDYPVYGMSTRWGWDYAVMFNGSSRVARCNPVNAPEGCCDEELVEVGA